MDKTEQPQPTVIDMRSRSRQDLPTGLDMLYKSKAAEAMIAKADKLGGFSVRILAEEGDPYQTINDHDDGKVTRSPIHEVPEGYVIISATNTGNPSTPTNLAPIL